jgi:hypothetical protein
MRARRPLPKESIDSACAPRSTRRLPRNEERCDRGKPLNGPSHGLRPENRKARRREGVFVWDVWACWCNGCAPPLPALARAKLMLWVSYVDAAGVDRRRSPSDAVVRPCTGTIAEGRRGKREWQRGRRGLSGTVGLTGTCANWKSLERKGSHVAGPMDADPSHLPLPQWGNMKPRADAPAVVARWRSQTGAYPSLRPAQMRTAFGCSKTCGVAEGTDRVSAKQLRRNRAPASGHVLYFWFQFFDLDGASGTYDRRPCDSNPAVRIC